MTRESAHLTVATHRGGCDNPRLLCFGSRRPPGANPRASRDSEVWRSAGDRRKSQADLDPFSSATVQNKVCTHGIPR